MLTAHSGCDGTAPNSREYLLYALQSGADALEVDVRRRYGVNIIAIERNHQTDVDFSAQYRFQKGDVVAVIGKVDKIDRFENSIQN